MKLRKYEAGGALNSPGDPAKKGADARSEFLERAQKMSGRELKGLTDLPGLNFDKLKGMSDDEMKGLLDLVQRMAPEDKGDVSGGIKNAMGNLGEIKDTVQGLRDNYDLDTRSLVDGILDQRGTGFIKSGLIKTAASAAGLYAKGGFMKLRKTKY